MIEEEPRGSVYFVCMLFEHECMGGCVVCVCVFGFFIYWQWSTEVMLNGYWSSTVCELSGIGCYVVV